MDGACYEIGQPICQLHHSPFGLIFKLVACYGKFWYNGLALITLFIGAISTKGAMMKERIQDFLKFLELEKRYSENTVVAYQNDLFQFLEYVLNPAIKEPIEQWREADKNLLNTYIDYLKTSTTYSSSTVARKIAAVKSFFNFLQAKGDLDNDPTEELDAPKVQKRLPKALTPDEVDRLLQAPASDDSPKSQRDLALLEMLYGSGMRVTELVSLDVSDLNLERDNGTVQVRGKKNNRRRSIPINGPVLEAVRYYVENGREKLVQDPNIIAVFVNNRGKRLTRQGLWLIIKHYVKTVGIATHVTPHTLRHSFAAHKLSQGKSLQDIQQLLGHANISTTQVYAHNKPEEVKTPPDNIKELTYRR